MEYGQEEWNVGKGRARENGMGNVGREEWSVGCLLVKIEFE